MGPAQELVLLLHGRGADENDLLSLAELFSSTSRVFSVRAPYSLGAGFAWHTMRADGSAVEEELAHSVAEIGSLIESVEPAIPVVLLGFSQGGLVAVQTAAQQKVRDLRAVVTLSAPPLHDALPYQPLAGIPVFWGHGLNDGVVSWDRGLRMRGLLESMGASLTARSYAMGHTIMDEELVDIKGFLQDIGGSKKL